MNNLQNPKYMFRLQVYSHCTHIKCSTLNLLFKHTPAMRAILAPPKTMNNRKLYGIYYHIAVHHASVIYMLVCLSSINAKLLERFLDRIVDITRKTWSKHA